MKITTANLKLLGVTFLLGLLIGGGGVWSYLNRQHQSDLREAKEELVSKREVIVEKIVEKQIEYEERVHEIQSKDYHITISNQVLSWD